MLQSINPTTGEVLRMYEATREDELDAIIESAHAAFLAWRRTSFTERARCMKNTARALREQADGHARLMALEMGKPLGEGKAEIEKCGWACDYFADHAEQFLARESVKTDASESYVQFDPLGVVLAVMPWNFPFWQVFRFAAPALMAGNAVLLKHASNVCGCALAIEEILRHAGFPPGLFRTLLIDSETVARVVEHRRVRAVTLTGSSFAGRSVATVASRSLKKTVLELGGSDPYLVLEDANIDEAARLCAASRLINSGQSCIAAKRFVVVQPHVRRFEELFVQHMQAAKVGDPLHATTTVGPLARRDLRDHLHRQVARSVELGARCILGGQVPDGPGSFYPPTVLTAVRRGMPAYEEELFGPVAAIIPVDDEREAVDVANDSVFGLGAAVFTGDVERARRIVSELEAGSCFVNSFVRSDPRLPFGGVKESGYGRELSHYGIKEFVNIKTVYVR